jgi:hypothetical protein
MIDYTHELMQAYDEFDKKEYERTVALSLLSIARSLEKMVWKEYN